MEKQELSLEQLKALAYDCLAQVELWQMRLKEANQRINNFKVEAPEVKEIKKDK